MLSHFTSPDVSADKRWSRLLVALEDLNRFTGSKVRVLPLTKGKDPRTEELERKTGLNPRPHWQGMLYQLSHFRLRSAHPEVVPRARFNGDTAIERVLYQLSISA